MNKSRIERVIANMNACGLDQILVTATPSVYYLTGKWVSPGERMLALYLNSNGDTALYANRLFALNGSEGINLVEFDDTEDPVVILAQQVKAGKIGIDKKQHDINDRKNRKIQEIRRTAFDVTLIYKARIADLLLIHRKISFHHSRFSFFVMIWQLPQYITTVTISKMTDMVVSIPIM